MPRRGTLRCGRSALTGSDREAATPAIAVMNSCRRMPVRMRHCKRPNSTSERYRGQCNAICLEVPDVPSGSDSDLGPRSSQVRSTLNSGNRQTARACPYRIVSLGRVISDLVWHQQAQRCIVSNALLAKERHCIDLGTGIVEGTKKSDVLDAGRHRSPGWGMFLTGYFTLPISDGAFIAGAADYAMGT
jgi:hypothetical protein